MANTFVSSGSISGSFLISATGPFGFAKGLLSGGTATDAAISAVATSATTQAVIAIEEAVNGGSITAKGNAQIYLDGATVSGATLATTGTGAEIGVLGGGSATVTDATVSKGSYIFDDGTLAFSGGTAQAGVTFLAYGTQASDGSLTLSNTTIGAGDHLLAELGGVLNVSAAATLTLSAGTVVSATSGGTVNVYGGVGNSGTVEALANGDEAPGADIWVYGGTGGFTNVKGALVEARASGSYDDTAQVWISGGGAAINSGTAVASATGGVGDLASLSFEGGTVSNAKGATIEAAASLNAGSTAYLYGSAGVANDGTIKGLASGDSHYQEGVEVDATSGTIANTGTIGVAATSGSEENLGIFNASGGLTNAKGAIISASATAGSEVEYFEIIVDGAIDNSGTIVVSAAGDSSASDNNYLDGGSLTNSGTIAVAASAESSADLGIDVTSGNLTNSGTIAATASNKSYAEQSGEFFGTGSLTNTGSMTATATADGEARQDWSLDGGALVNAASIKASATGSGSDADFDIYDLGSASTNTGKIVAAATGGGYSDVGIGANYESATITNSNLIEASAAGGTAYVDVTAYSDSGSIVNSGTIEASAAGGYATVDLYTDGVDATIVNSGTIEASAAGGTAYVGIGGNTGAIVNNSGGTLLATAAGGTAYVDLGDYDANVSGGTLKTVGANAYLGVIGYNYREASATNVTIAADSNIVGWDGTLALTNIVGSISAGTLIQGANDGEVDIYVTSSLNNSGTIQAYVNDYSGYGTISISGGALTNFKTIEAVATSAFYYDADLSMGGTSLTNTKTGVIAALATGESYEYNDVTADYTSITNSGLVLASASDSSDASVALEGGTISNTSAGKIEAIATDQSEAWVAVVGNTTNAGLIEAQGAGDSDAAVYLSGTISNAGGTILAAGNGQVYLGADNSYDAVVIGGTLKTSGSAATAIVTDGDTATLSGVDIASGSLVVAEDGGVLTLGSGTVIGNTKAGTSPAVVDAYAGIGDVVVSGTLYNSGLLIAGGGVDTYGPGGTVEITGGAVVSGPGAVVIDEFGTVQVDSGGTATVTFGLATSAVLALADTATTPAASDVTVSGFGGVAGEFPGQLIDLTSVTYAADTFSATYSLTPPSNANPNLDVGTLTVSSGGGVVADITLVGNYVSGAVFNVVDDNGTVAISDPLGGAATLAGAGNATGPNVGTGAAALLGGYIAALFASPEGQVGGATAETAQSQAVLVHPHA